MAALNQPIKQWAARRVWIIGASSGIGEAREVLEGLAAYLQAKKTYFET
ncbi:MAG: short-chain dehydrogenase, partial [Comamonadaceae bacterium]